MQVNLRQQTMRIVGEGGELGAVIAERLAVGGAVTAAEPAAIDVAVAFAHVAPQEAGALAALCRTLAADMGEGGRLLIIAAVTGLVPVRGDAAAPAHAAILALSRLLALELAARGIRVNALAVPPADVAVAARMRSHAPRGLPDVASLADAALFLLDPDNSYTTGHVLVADGGWSVGYARDF